MLINTNIWILYRYLYAGGNVPYPPLVYIGANIARVKVEIRQTLIINSEKFFFSCSITDYCELKDKNNILKLMWTF